jgi:hypothetical protein
MFLACSWTFEVGPLPARQCYRLLERASRAARTRRLPLLAMGLAHDELRLLVQGRHPQARAVLAALRSGTSRALKPLGFHGRPVELRVADDATSGAAWCHAVATGDPLAWTWSTHRDLLGFRRTDFFDPRPLRRRARPADVHRLAGGHERVRPPPHRRLDLDHLLRIAGAVQGRLPADPRSFALFVQLARHVGYDNAQLAPALRLTKRRVRQLAGAPHPLLRVARAHLRDARLWEVP